MSSLIDALRQIGSYLHPSYIKKSFLQALRLGDPPESIAMGITVGIFLGIFPTFYLGLVLAALGARIFKYNMIAAIAGTAVATPLTAPFFLAASAALGGWITGLDWGVIMAQLQGERIWAAAGTAVIAYLIGNIILCILFCVPAYFLTKKAVVEYRRRRGVEA